MERRSTKRLESRWLQIVNLTHNRHTRLMGRDIRVISAEMNKIDVGCRLRPFQDSHHHLFVKS